MSTPDRNRCVAVVCRIVCGLTRLPATDGIVAATAAAYTLHQRVDPEPGQRLAPAVEEDVLRRGTAAHQRKQSVDCPGPQRAAAWLVPLAVDQHRRGVTARHRPQVEVGDPHVGRLVGTGARVVQEQQHRMIAAALGRVSSGAASRASISSFSR